MANIDIVSRSLNPIATQVMRRRQRNYLVIPIKAALSALLSELRQPQINVLLRSSSHVAQRARQEARRLRAGVTASLRGHHSARGFHRQLIHALSGCASDREGTSRQQLPCHRGWISKGSKSRPKCQLTADNLNLAAALGLLRMATLWLAMNWLWRIVAS